MREKSQIPLVSVKFEPEDLKAVADVLELGMVSTSVPFVQNFERKLAAATGAKYAIATNSGTAALELALRARFFGKRGCVLVPDLTFIATANAVVNSGLTPIFCDVDPETWALDAKAIRQEIGKKFFKNATGEHVTEAASPLLAIIFVPIGGTMDGVLEVRQLAKELDVPLIIDGAGSLGALDTPEGNVLDFATAVTLSFNGNKILTTGGGGALLCNDAALAEFSNKLATVGKKRQYESDMVGFNYKLPALNCALGFSQLDRLAQIVKRKKQIAEFYCDGFKASTIVTIPPFMKSRWSNNWIQVIKLATKELSSDQVIQYMAKLGMGCSAFWMPMSYQRPYKNYGYLGSGVSQSLWKDCLVLPSWVGLDQVQLNRIIRTLESVAE